MNNAPPLHRDELIYKLESDKTRLQSELEVGKRAYSDLLVNSMAVGHELNDLRAAVAKKIKTWERLGKCSDEFNGDMQYCAEYIEADDAAMLELIKVHVNQTSATQEQT